MKISRAGFRLVGRWATFSSGDVGAHPTLEYQKIKGGMK